MARITEGSHGTHATLAHATRSEILAYLKHKDYVRVGQIAEAWVSPLPRSPVTSRS